MHLKSLTKGTSITKAPKSSLKHREYVAQLYASLIKDCGSRPMDTKQMQFHILSTNSEGGISQCAKSKDKQKKEGRIRGRNRRPEIYTSKMPKPTRRLPELTKMAFHRDGGHTHEPLDQNGDSQACSKTFSTLNARASSSRGPAGVIGWSSTATLVTCSLVCF
jgi:hypothetical protein